MILLLGLQNGAHGISLGCLADFKGASMRFPSYSFVISMEFLGESYRNSMIFRLDFRNISLKFQQNFCGVQNDFYGISMAFPWASCGMPTGFV